MSGILPRTRLVAAPSLGPRVYLKLESEMPTGSFKVRGALHALSVKAGLKGPPYISGPKGPPYISGPKGPPYISGPKGPPYISGLKGAPYISGVERSNAGLKGRRSVTDVVASSTGNHGAAVAWAAERLGVHATIFLPRDPNPVKKANIVRLGATVVEHGRDLAEAFEAATEHAARTGAFFLNDATDPDLPNGPAGIADEIVDDCPDLEVIYVPVGDTALIRGVAGRAKERKPGVRIIGVQADTAPSYYLSWRDGGAVPTPTALTIADGLATRTPVEDNVRAIRTLVDEMQLVSDDAMLAAVGRLIVDEHLVAEPSAAATVAAFVADHERAQAATTVLLITGCNIQPELLRLAIERVV